MDRLLPNRTSSTTRIFSQFLPLSFLVVAVAIVGCHCGAETETAAGDTCHAEGERDGNLTCVDGEWVQDEADAGFTDIIEGDACEPESHEEFCERYEVECGSFTGEDNCGHERNVHCEEFDGYTCEDSETCVYADDNNNLDTNTCRCPELGDDPAREICNYADAECGTVDAEDVCEAWAGLGEVECGECDGGDECGEEIDNVCGCPCEIDGQCYVDGDSSPDEECLICDPDESSEAFTEAEDGTECEETGICEGGECICEQDEAECDGTCVDLDSNRDHCGECDTACDDNEVCDDGECTEGCSDDEALCDGMCVDTDTDTDHCGECDSACSTDDDTATAECDEGACVIECDDENETYCTDACTDTDTDEDHCGECGSECSTDIDGAIAQCIDGECEISCEDDAHTLCEDEQICANLDNDEDHCGECGNECGDTQVCFNETCEGPGGSCEGDGDCLPNQQCCDDECIAMNQQCN